MGNKHHEPGGRAEGRRRQFEDSRGLTGPGDLPLDDELSADEPAVDEPVADGRDPDELDSDEPDSDELDSEAEAGDPDEASPPAGNQADDQG